MNKKAETKTDEKTSADQASPAAVASSGLFGWRPIKEAPRDGTRILVPMGKSIVIVEWYTQQYHRNPRPYWHYGMSGVQWDRENQPEVWMPLPKMPNANGDGRRESAPPRQ